jgi:sialate O-acetylesterase
MEYAMRKNSKVNPKLGEGMKPNPVNELDFVHHKNIRLFLVNRKELIKPDSLHAGWNIAEGNALRAFSAVAYFFAKKINQDLNVPVGMISSAIPGSRIEPWINEDDFLNSTYFSGKKVDGDPGKFYHSMIEPLAPFAIKGFLWYQGETNCFLKERLVYTQKMEVLINGWRKNWNDHQLPFCYVQIAPFLYTTSKGEVKYTPQDLPEFWEAQAAVTKIPNTGMAVITDLVDDLNGIHPPYKWEVGSRLALLALDKTYQKNIVSSGPVFDKMEIKKDEIILNFNFAKGLKSKDGKPLNYFEIAGVDGNYVPATAQIKGGKIIVSANMMKQPKNVRFAWNEGAQANLFNSANLPARPFRTDDQIINLFNP